MRKTNREKGYCLYSETRVMLKLGKRATGHFVVLIEICMHLIMRILPGIWWRNLEDWEEKF